jgi:hypothetical protein
LTRFYPGDFVAAEEDFARVRELLEAPDFSQIGAVAKVMVVSTFSQGVGTPGLLGMLMPPASVMSACAESWRGLSGIHGSLRSRESRPPICTS